MFCLLIQDLTLRLREPVRIAVDKTASCSSCYNCPFCNRPPGSKRRPHTRPIGGKQVCALLPCCPACSARTIRLTIGSLHCRVTNRYPLGPLSALCRLTALSARCGSLSVDHTRLMTDSLSARYRITARCSIGSLARAASRLNLLTVMPPLTALSA